MTAPDLSGRSTVWLDQGWQPAFIGFCPNKKAWRKLVKQFGLKDEPWPEADGHTHTFQNSSGALCIVVTIQPPKDRSLVEMIGIIAHESTHVWQFVRQEMREDCPGIETEAYAIQAITQNVFAAWWDTGGKDVKLRPR